MIIIIYLKSLFKGVDVTFGFNKKKHNYFCFGLVTYRGRVYRLYNITLRLIGAKHQ